MKRVFVVFIVACMLFTVGCAGDSSNSVSEKKTKSWKYVSPIEAHGFLLDNTAPHLLVSFDDETGDFEAVDEVTAETCRIVFQKSAGQAESGSSIQEEIEFYRSLTEEDGFEPTEVTIIQIAGYDSAYYSWQDQNDDKYKRFYVVLSDTPVCILISSDSEDYSTLSNMVETMVRADSEEAARLSDTTAEDTAQNDSSSSTTSENVKKREMSNMDDDEIFMVMALAEKEIKNNLTYDAKKAKFSHQPEDWYMSEQDGYYTVMTTFEAPNEYGTMQKAGAVVSFTVTSKSSDGWNYKDEDVYIEWKQ